MSQPPVRSRTDRAGIVIATLCFVHCVAGPGLLTFAGLASVINISERFEVLFLLGSAAMGALALFPAYRRHHGRLSCLAMFGAGFAVLLVRRHIGGSLLEPASVLIGASLIVGAHVLNVRYSRRCACCEPALPAQIQTAPRTSARANLAIGRDRTKPLNSRRR
jgi:MerC mercury resistance protein